MFVLRRTAGRYVAPFTSLVSSPLSTPNATALWQTVGGKLGGGAAEDRRHLSEMTREAVLGWSPVETVAVTLDRLHHATQLPWWAMLSLTAISLRATMFPFTIKQARDVRLFCALYPISAVDADPVDGTHDELHLSGGQNCPRPEKE